MNNVPLIGIHWLQLNRQPGGLYAFGKMLHARDEVIHLHETIMLHIHLDAGRIVIFRLEHAIKKKLDLLKCFTTSADEQLVFRTVHLKQETSGFTPRLFDFADKTKIT